MFLKHTKTHNTGICISMVVFMLSYPVFMIIAGELKKVGRVVPYMINICERHFLEVHLTHDHDDRILNSVYIDFLVWQVTEPSWLWLKWLSSTQTCMNVLKYMIMIIWKLHNDFASDKNGYRTFSWLYLFLMGQFSISKGLTIWYSGWGVLGYCMETSYFFQLCIQNQTHVFFMKPMTLSLNIILLEQLASTYFLWLPISLYFNSQNHNWSYQVFLGQYLFSQYNPS